VNNSQSLCVEMECLGVEPMTYTLHVTYDVVNDVITDCHLIMVALCNSADHHIFVLFLPFFFFYLLT